MCGVANPEVMHQHALKWQQTAACGQENQATTWSELDADPGPGDSSPDARAASPELL